MSGVKRVGRVEVEGDATQRSLDRVRYAIDGLMRPADPARKNTPKRGGDQGTNRATAIGLSGARHIADTALANASVVRLKHGLGSKLRGWMVTDLRGASTSGRVERVLTDGTGTADDGEDLWLKATGWGATITVRVTVF